MIRAGAVAPAGAWPEAQAADRVVLDFDRRSRRRIALTTEGGLEVVLDLPHATVLRDGDALKLDDGRLVRVVAAPEALAEVGAPDPEQLARIAWHLGNRHLPVQITGRVLRIRRDHVIEDMLRRLGAAVTAVEAPFDPEGGAYGEGRAHGHHHHHDDDDHHHHHGHGHGHGHHH
jgi:urease accessory protein